MNDTLSLVLVTSILAIGGFGYYMYKNNDGKNKKGGKRTKDEDYNESSLFGFKETNSKKEDDDDDEDDEDDDDESVSDTSSVSTIEDKIESPKSKTKTKRNNTNVGTKKRY